ncbi:hypothetical protein E0Z10_g2254 [Xylaria hypoxylon]|uniref:TauD/TfdA-like domain-containing protein n=1 Tax=Xylaria hypoxylon TaxID=37992 RepID=A0A4Z0YRE0_9PEZI|nr:hypothetical protein E0Z10_g2254 [Xylaria hypoxylon]
MAAKTYQTITVIRSGKACGATLNGLDITTLSNLQINEITEALDKDLVGCFPECDLNGDQLLDIAFRMSRGKDISRPAMKKTDITNQSGKGDYELDWHVDGYFEKVGPKIGLLIAVVLVPNPVSTFFCNMQRLLKDVPENIKEELKGKWIHNDCVYYPYGIHPVGPLRQGQTAPETDNWHDWPGVRHPAIHVDKTTGKKAIFLGARKWAYIEGIDRTRSREILDILWSMVDSGNYTFEVKWAPRTLVMWRNDFTMHYRPRGDGKERLLYRASVPGEELIMAE